MVFGALLLSVLHPEAQARKRGGDGPSGTTWKKQTYDSEALAKLQGSAHRAWSKEAKGWVHSNADPSDGALEEWWCQGKDVGDTTCWTGAITGLMERGVAWRGMGGYLVDGKVEQLWLTAGEIPTEGAWGASYRVEVGGTPLQVQDFEVQFVRFGENANTEKFVVTPIIQYSVEKTDFPSSPKPSGSGWVSFTDLITSPESLAGAAAPQLEALLARVQKGIEAHEPRKCSYGEYFGDDAPPCRLVPLQSTEAHEWSVSAEQTLNHRAFLIRSDQEQLYALMMALLPAETSSLLLGH